MILSICVYFIFAFEWYFKLLEIYALTINGPPPSFLFSSQFFQDFNTTRCRITTCGCHYLKSHLKSQSRYSLNKTPIKALYEFFHFLYFFNILSDVCNIESFVASAHLLIPKELYVYQETDFFPFFFKFYLLLLMYYLIK